MKNQTYVQVYSKITDSQSNTDSYSVIKHDFAGSGIAISELREVIASKAQLVSYSDVIVTNRINSSDVIYDMTNTYYKVSDSEEPTKNQYYTANKNEYLTDLMTGNYIDDNYYELALLFASVDDVTAGLSDYVYGYSIKGYVLNNKSVIIADYTLLQDYKGLKKGTYNLKYYIENNVIVKMEYDFADNGTSESHIAYVEYEETAIQTPDISKYSLAG
jgi:hypothetical protein